MPERHDDSIDLASLFGNLAKSSPAAPSQGVESRLRLSLRARRDARRRHQGRILVAAAALAACLLLALAWEMRAPHRVVSLPPQTSGYAGFLALPYAESGVPLEHATVIPVEVQPDDLKALGLPPRYIGHGKRRADLLIGQDGIARAVRISQ